MLLVFSHVEFRFFLKKSYKKVKTSSWEEERYQWEGLRRTRDVEVVKALDTHTKTSRWDATFYIITVC